MGWMKLVSVVVVVVVLVGVALELQGEAKQHVVGDDMGWTNYDTRNFEVPNYNAWAASQKVVVADQIVFKYAKGKHNVNLLPNQAAYASCDFSKARVLDSGQSGVYVWNASRVGVYYFGCNKEVEEEGNHCGSGQKLTVLVVASSTQADLTAAAAPVPSPSPSPPPVHGHDGALVHHLQSSGGTDLLAHFSACLLVAFPVMFL